MTETRHRSRAISVFRRFLSPTNAADLEHGCYCQSLVDGASYRRTVLSALHGLEHGNLAALVGALGAASALSSPVEAVFGSCTTMQVVEEQEITRARARETLRDLVHDERLNVPDAGIRCTSCKSSNVRFCFMQTRSADEGTTIYCTCVCGKRWKM
jgi:DNA-directed RNA polymerase subunit M/transcription elongation factor TFIIS